MRDHLQSVLADRYTIERELGRGGMATVWLARDVRHDRSVAIKVLHPDLAGAIGVDRFLREVRVTAQLQHPNIIPLLDSGVLPSEDGTRLPWYAMSYVAGESLRTRLDRERQLPIDDAVRIAEDIASALQSAHRVGIVHRDIKPENVLLADGRVYVVDFGIAKAVIETGDDRLTSTGIAVGTPAYMSPEQASATTVDARSDQYSLASIVYEMLIGEPPFTGPTAQAIVARRFAETARPLRSVRSTVPVPVESAVLKALEPVPADRFSDVSAFAAALRDGGARETAHGYLQRGTVAALAAALLVAIALGSQWLRKSAGGFRAPTRDPVAVSLYERGLRGYDRRTPAGITDAITAFTAAVQRDSTFAAAWAGLAKAYVRAYERRFEFPGGVKDSVLRLAVAAGDRALAADRNNSDVWLTQAIVSRNIDPTDVRAAIRSARHAIALDSSNAPAWHTLALSLAESGDFDGAMEAWGQCARRGPAYTQGLAFLALGYYWRRQYDSAAVLADSAVAVDPGYLLGRTTAGGIEVERGNYARGSASYEAARRLSTDVEVVNALAGVALGEARAGHAPRARATLRTAETLAAAYSPAPLHTAVYLAAAYAALGDADHATDWLARYSPGQDLHFQLHLRCDPPFDPIKADPRFKALLLRPAPPSGRGC